MKCKEVFKEIKEKSEQYLSILEDVCNIESPTSFKQGVDAVGNYFVKMAEDRGFSVERFTQEISGDALCITLNPDAQGAPICLSGHMDTVHPIGLFGNPPVKRDSEKIYGPGVVDCKGGCVAAFLAMDALLSVGFKDRKIMLILQSDEENGSRTSNKETVKYMCKKAKGAATFINLEGQEGKTVVLERKGILQYKITVCGKAAHSSICQLGANAISEAAYKIIELEKMKEADALTCNCGIISGGTVPNTVAEKCEFVADIRYKNGEQLERAKKKVSQILEKVYVEGCETTAVELNTRPAMPYCERNEKLLSKINEIFSQNALPTLSPILGFGGSDAAYITECGISCIDNFGTDGGLIHSANEFAYISSLEHSAKELAAICLCL